MSNDLIFGERRLFERKSCSFNVSLEEEERTRTGHLRNLSLGGAFIEADLDTTSVQGQEIVLTIPFRKKRNQLKIKGKIARIKPNGFGVKFLKPRNSF